jgi:hypothetical protein
MARKKINVEGEETWEVISLDDVDLSDRSVPADITESSVAANGKENGTAASDAVDEHHHDGGPKHVALYDHLDVNEQMKKTEFIFATIYHCVCLLWILAYMGTVEIRLMSLAPDQSEDGS